MRFIDFYIGVPLCFIVSILLWPFLKKPQLGQCKKVLFIELSEMGSAILVDPAMRKLKVQANADLFFVIFSQNRLSLEILNTIPKENIFCIRAQSLWTIFVDTMKYFIWIRKNNIDTVIDLELFSRYTALLTGFSGARNRVGFYGYHNEGLYRGSFLTHKVLYNPHIHISKNFLSLTHAALSKVMEEPYSKISFSQSDIQIQKVSFSLSELNHFREKLTKIIDGLDFNAHKILLVNANASDMLPQRRWMPSYFVSVIKKIILTHPEAFVILTGAASEAHGLNYIVHEVQSDRCMNSAGKIDFQDLSLLYSVSTLLLTNDSGPAHFASVTEIPIHVLFGPENPNLYSSLGNFTPHYAHLACSPCVSAANHRKTSCEDNLCLKKITPEQVFQSISPYFNS